MNMHRLPVEHGAAAIGSAAKRARVVYSKAGRQITVDRNFPHGVTLNPIDLSINRLT